MSVATAGSLRLLVTGFAFVLLLAPPRAGAMLVADDAADICAPATEPCIVAQEVSVVAGSRLDFGLRTLRLQGAGLLDFGAGDAAIDCGRFEAVPSGAALRLRGSTPDGSAGGDVTLLVRRHCTLAASRPCLSNADCGAGAGSCSGGAGDVVLAGAVLGNADRPGRLRIEAAADIALQKNVSLAAAKSASDGGVLDLVSRSGSIRIAAPVDVSGGGAATGGEISLVAGGDVLVEAALSATGGDYDGGTISLQADRDVIVHDDLRVESLAGAGFGGEIDIAAGRDAVVSGGGAANSLALAADGHQSIEAFGGDGGTVAVDAGRHLAVSRYVRISVNGAAPDGFADTVSFSAGGNIAIDGRVEARGRGTLGGGGIVEIDGDAEVRLAETASFDLGGTAAGGDLDLSCDGALDSAATVDASGATNGVGGRIFATAGGDATISGPWKTAGAETAFSVGELVLEGCHVVVAAALDNAAQAGRNRITAHESLTIGQAASLDASGAGATNTLRYRSAGKPPRLLGSVAPAPALVVDAALAGCPVCGNGELDQGESCDDGNLAAGDGCSALCQDEGCEAESAGDPDGELCGDANECTIDQCNGVTHRCEHAPQQGSCDDADFCTLDESCHEGICTSPARPALLVNLLKIRFGREPGQEPGQEPGMDRATVKASFPAWWLATSPADTNLRAVLSDERSKSLVDLVVPAGAFTGRSGAWSLSSAEDHGIVGLVAASIRSSKSGGDGRVKLRLANTDLGATASATVLRLALLLGDDPATGSCTSSAALGCVRGPSSLRCAAPREPGDDRQADPTAGD